MNPSSFRPVIGRKARIAGIALTAAVLTALAVAALVVSHAPAPSPEPEKTAGKPALTVTPITPQTLDWPQILPANGNVVAWQEAIIGPEISNYRLTDVAVQVGDHVRKGQILARIDSESVASELAEASATVSELQASAAEAKSNAERARELRAQGFYSSQLNTQYQTAANTANARLAAAEARRRSVELRLGKTSVRAPDDGVISARSATVGSLTQPGQELFRLIRGGRLEWRAEIAAADLAVVQPGFVAHLVAPDGQPVRGRVRAVAPSVDPQTRNGLVYVDLPAGAPISAGMFARGEFELGRRPALTLPQSAVVLREGFASVFRLATGDRVAQIKVTLGRRQGERVEILAGLAADARVVETGAAFLADGDVVKVVDRGGTP